MLALVVLHLVGALLLPALPAHRTRLAFTLAAIPPLAALIWIVAHAVLGAEAVENLRWAPRIGLSFAFRLDALGVLMTILVSGIGAVVLLYSRRYFHQGGGDARRSAPLLLAFAGAMLGLVLADDLITVYVFWELTTICSYLLVGQAGISRTARRAALQALIITTLGGLVMLVGFVVLGEAAGTYRISELVAHPPDGAAVPVAAALVLVGAFTKSAQVPFHNWLPAAMVAPTPISAYLHAASMVKAGVFLVARLAPVFSGVPTWFLPCVLFGAVTMLLAGWQALREYDLKKLLAYSTVSQLGFVLILVGAGTRMAAVAGVTMLLAHGLSKATLFLTVGIIDHATGTRDLRALSGIGRRERWLAAGGALAAASMAGLPLLVGFLGKEAAFAAFVGGGAEQRLVLAVLVLGSALTVGYTARWWWGAFATKPGTVDIGFSGTAREMTVLTALPALACLALGLLPALTGQLASSYARDLDGADYTLALWHGLTLPLGCSLLALAGGALIHRNRARILRVPRVPFLDAQRGFERAMAMLERVAVAVTGRTQAGSLPTYIGIILLTVLAVPGSALLIHTRLPADINGWDQALEIPPAVIILIAAVAVVRARRRLTAVIMVGVIGYAIGGLFIIGGGPDLALAQLLVETLTLVAFVFVLRRLPARFTATDTSGVLRAQKLVVACAAGIMIGLAAVVFSAARDTTAGPSQAYVALSKEVGATNVVNAIIVDFRAFDTIGEIAVLAVAATGVASLILASRFERRQRARHRHQAPGGAVTQTPKGGDRE